MESMINFLHSAQRLFWNVRSSQQLLPVGTTQTYNERQNFQISGVVYSKLEVLCVKKSEVSSKLKTYFNKHLVFQLKKINISLPKGSSKREAKANYRNNLYRNKLYKNGHIYPSESMVYCREAAFIENSIPLT